MAAKIRVIGIGGSVLAAWFCLNIDFLYISLPLRIEMFFLVNNTQLF